jgi:hypothetical protein
MIEHIEPSAAYSSGYNAVRAHKRAQVNAGLIAETLAGSPRLRALTVVYATLRAEFADFSRAFDAMPIPALNARRGNNRRKALLRQMNHTVLRMQNVADAIRLEVEGITDGR